MSDYVLERRECSDAALTALPNSLHPVLRRIYLQRGVSSSKDLQRDLGSMHAFDSLSQIDIAVERIANAIKQQQRILIVGDYDADGATSTALAVKALRAMGAKYVDYLVPNRFQFGYGLTPEIVELAQQIQPDVLITVDNGVASLAGVSRANEFGIDVIVTDHHLAGDALPDAVAIVNPNLPDDVFPSKALAGVGVIFYVMVALRRYLDELGWFEQQQLQCPNMGRYLDLVALGTVADVVPLDANNRIMVYQGIQRIRARQCCPGILALLQVSRRDPVQLQASDLGFCVGPRLNAAGRLDDMSLGIECLLADNMEAALVMAQELDRLNRERRSIEDGMKSEALTILEHMKLGNADQLPAGLCLYDETWHQGVIGIVASRIKDKLHRPVITFANSDEHEIKGSGRSIKGLHLRDCLDAISKRQPDLIIKFGGHAMAAGLSIARERFAEFADLFAEEVERQVPASAMRGVVESDGELGAEDLNLALAEAIRSAGPWGQQFPEPLFDGQFSILDQRIVGERHLKLLLSPVGDVHSTIDAIAFNVDRQQWPNYRCHTITAAYRLDINEFNGLRKLQLIIEHLWAA